ncbi:MAG: hypothetical protein LQ341_001452 [Variospora aurantia]|nr:MAG: hypothetical protein LQ341_001452 [Variospora aurantia]
MDSCLPVTSVSCRLPQATPTSPGGASSVSSGSDVKVQGEQGRRQSYLASYNTINMTNTATIQGRGWPRSANLNAYAQSIPYGQYQSNAQYFTNDVYNENFDPSLNGLSQSMAGMMLQGADYSGAPKQNIAGTASGVANLAGVPASPANSGMFYALPNGGFVYSNVHGTQNTYSQYLPGYGLGAAHSGQFQQTPFQSLANNAPATPNGPAWSVAPHLAQEVPELTAPRRTSLSSNEADSPRTPMFNNYLGGYHAQMVGPSPQSGDLGSLAASNPDTRYQFAKDRTGKPYVEDFEAWTTMSPVIPIAIPAIDSPGGGRGTLEQIIYNPNSTTNVYVRGLHPETSDEDLLAYGKRFGKVDSAKSIIDAATGLCKGFGFIKYLNFNDAENCIRGFYYRKYEAKFARVGHNERLKTLANPDNTNLYLSNLPKSMNEADLQAIFKSKHPEYTIVNHKVLKDENGLSRGVGFARFETPEICHKIIEEFSGMVLDEAKNLRLQIRYADTDEQKEFKAKTAKSRQFKATEYTRGIELFRGQLYGYPSPTAACFGSPLQANMSASNGMWMSPSPMSPTYPWQSQYAQSHPVMAGANTLINPVPLQARASARVKIESPSMVATAKRSSTTLVNSPTDSEEEEPVPVSKLDLAVPHEEDAYVSPTKSKL